MTLPRRVRLTLGATSAVLLAGVLGLAWWSWRHRPGHEPPAARFPRTRAALVALGLLVIALGAAWRLAIAIKPAPACTPPSGPLPTAPLTGWVVTQKAITWAETGIGALYAEADAAHLCWSPPANYYVAVNAHHIIGVRAMTMGDIVLTPGFDIPGESKLALIEHEARHRPQWAVGTLIAGPLGLPVAYGIADFFFPGARNPFERMAGLESGMYTPTGTGPVLGPAQLAVLRAAGAVIVAAPLAVRRRRAAARSRGPR